VEFNPLTQIPIGLQKDLYNYFQGGGDSFTDVTEEKKLNICYWGIGISESEYEDPEFCEIGPR
jgi:hypothetical protein